MPRNQLDRHEKWVLVHIYLKNVKEVVPEGWRGMRMYSARNKLLPTEFYLNYYEPKGYDYRMGIETRRQSSDRMHSKTTQALMEKGLVISGKLDKYGPHLTDKGEEKAEELLSLYYPSIENLESIDEKEEE